MGGDIMEKTPGRPIESSFNRKTQLSSDAKIIAALIKLQPQTKEEICEKQKSATEPSTESSRYWKNSK